jgi:hypothetical protein
MKLNNYDDFKDTFYTNFVEMLDEMLVDRAFMEYYKNEIRDLSQNLFDTYDNISILTLKQKIREFIRQRY